MDYLWEENTKFKNDIKVIELDMKSKLTSQFEQTKPFETLLEPLERKLGEVEKNYDTKLEVFTLELEKSFTQKIATLGK